MQKISRENGKLKQVSPHCVHLSYCNNGPDHAPKIIMIDYKQFLYH